MVDQNLNSLGKMDLVSQLSQFSRRLKDLENFMRGVPISAAHIKSITWDKAVGGILRLGGLNNVAGQLIVVDEAGNITGILDKTGLLIKNGKVTLEDENGVASLDSLGIVSLSQFASGSIIQSSEQDTSSTSYSDISGTSISFTLDREANVFITFDVTGYVSNLFTPVGNLVTVLNVDSSDQAKVLDTPGEHNYDTGAQFPNTAAASVILNLAAGSHTLKLRFKIAGSGTGKAFFASIAYVVLGK